MYRNKPELENPYMFSNIEVENDAIEVPVLHNIDPPRQVEHVNRPQNTNTVECQNSKNKTINSNPVGNGVITVSFS